jgi:hypothetical protein
MITNTTIGRYGRLGNQLYQYATAFSLAKKLNTELWIPEESETNIQIGRFNPVINDYDKYNNDLYRLFDLKFGIKKPLIEIESKITQFYNEQPKIRYYPELWDVKDNTCLFGYFQAKEYVDRFEHELRNELKFNDKFFKYGKDIIDTLTENHKRTVSLHVRRGDGLMDNFAFNAELTIENYYEKIINENISQDDIILVFSDDIDWCKNIFKEKNIIFIDNRDKENSHLFDFTLMSMCDVNIMAVSTFSWWACWLNPLNKEKTVYMPKNWWGYSLKENSEEVYKYDHYIVYEN